MAFESPEEQRRRELRLVVGVVLLMLVIVSAAQAIWFFGSTPLLGAPVPSWVIEAAIVSWVGTLAFATYAVHALASGPRPRGPTEPYSGD
ncbi:MAG TPA: hypothetical protein VMC82_05875 [Thermoplasmata archaeon]|nr:hypothetical protein [Thermoplasmata archaeon]